MGRATVVGSVFETEQDRVDLWRADRLTRAGYPPEIALALASLPHVDVTVACQLLEQGCPLKVALEILT